MAVPRKPTHRRATLKPIDQPEIGPPRRRFSGGLVTVLFSALALIAGLDAITDIVLGLPYWTIAIDLTLTTAALVVGATYWWRSVRLRRHATVLFECLEAARADAAHWRKEAAGVLPALGAAIHRQFERWGLTPDEQHVALLLLNGLSGREIAEIRHSTPRLVRQQTFAVYRKAGISTRAALSAFFLQDLLFLAGHPAERTEEPRLAARSVDHDPPHWN